MRLLRQTIGTDVRSRYEHEGEGSDPHAAADMRMAGAIGEMIFRHYPGHFWKVHVSSKQGVATISIPILMGPTACWIIKLSDLASDPSLKSVMRAAGEILERYKIPRSGLGDGVMQFIEAKERHRIIRLNDPFPG